jgi:hypothetical protein
VTASTHFLQDILRRKAEMGRRVDDLIGPGQDELYQAKLPRPVGPSCLRYWHRSQQECRYERWGGPSGGWASECPWIVYEPGAQPRRRPIHCDLGDRRFSCSASLHGEAPCAVRLE